ARFSVPPDGLVDVANQSLVLAALPKIAVQRWILAPSIVDELLELRVRLRRPRNEIAAVEQQTDVHIPRHCKHLTVREHRIRSAGDEIAADHGAWKCIGEDGDPRSALKVLAPEVH